MIESVSYAPPKVELSPAQNFRVSLSSLYAFRKELIMIKTLMMLILSLFLVQNPPGRRDRRQRSGRLAAHEGRCQHDARCCADPDHVDRGRGGDHGPRGGLSHRDADHGHRPSRASSRTRWRSCSRSGSWKSPRSRSRTVAGTPATKMSTQPGVGTVIAITLAAHLLRLRRHRHARAAVGHGDGPGDVRDGGLLHGRHRSSVSTTVISKTPMYLPGYIRQGGAYFIYANVTDAGCGIATVTAGVRDRHHWVDRHATGVRLIRSRWCRLQLSKRVAHGERDPDRGPQDLHHHVHRQRVEQPDPVRLQRHRRQHEADGTDVQTANGGATAGRPELGDTVTLTFAEEIDPQSVLAGSTGSATNVVVRIANNAGGDRITIRNAANTAQLPLGSVNLIGTAYVTANRDFGATGSASTMVQSGTTITITLGTPSGATGAQATTGTMTLTPTTTLTDAAGNTCQTTVANESGAADVEF